MTDSPAKEREKRQDDKAAVIRKILADAGYHVSANTQNRVRFSDTTGHDFYFEVEELEP